MKNWWIGFLKRIKILISQFNWVTKKCGLKIKKKKTQKDEKNLDEYKEIVTDLWK